MLTIHLNQVCVVACFVGALFCGLGCVDEPDVDDYADTCGVDAECEVVTARCSPDCQCGSDAVNRAGAVAFNADWKEFCAWQGEDDQVCGCIDVRPFCDAGTCALCFVNETVDDRLPRCAP
jgi:hypothetical protein